MIPRCFEDSAVDIASVSSYIWSILDKMTFRYETLPKGCLCMVSGNKRGIYLTYDDKTLSFCKESRTCLLIHEAGHILRYVFKDFEPYRTPPGVSHMLDNIIQDMCIDSWIEESIFTTKGLSKMPEENGVKIMYPPPKGFTGFLYYEAVLKYYKDNPDLVSEIPGSSFDIVEIDDLPDDLESFVRCLKPDKCVSKAVPDNDSNRIIQRDTWDPYYALLSDIKRRTKSKAVTTLTRFHKNYKLRAGRKKIASKVNIIADTSGSIYNIVGKLLGLVVDSSLTYLVVSTHNSAEVEAENVRGKQLLNVTLSGGGGTAINPGLQEIPTSERRNPTVIITDGYLFNEVVDLTGFRDVYIITTGNPVEVINRSALKVQVTLKL
ncbi:MAG: hypothetical protein GY861_20830 [bacterium]|nr:hypothetical protein [bacterium]